MVVEAQACGIPAIARAAGGALESVGEHISGQLIDSDSVTEGLKHYEHSAMFQVPNGKESTPCSSGMLRSRGIG